MSAHVLLYLLNKLGKEIKCEACRAFFHLFATNSIICLFVCFVALHHKYWLNPGRPVPL